VLPLDIVERAPNYKDKLLDPSLIFPAISQFDILKFIAVHFVG
jgi:hypothetical protein